MSHFATIVLTPVGRTSKACLDRLLEPYNENMEVEAYEEKCPCAERNLRRLAWHSNPKLNGQAYEEARKLLHVSHAHISQRMSEIEYQNSPETYEGEYEALDKQIDIEWHRLTDPIEKGRHDVEEQHRVAFCKPDALCDECHGTGTVQSTYNPKSKWDWWEIGGRWTGQLDGYDPVKDPTNWETCEICNGTGTRTMKVPGDPLWKPVSGQCNGCEQYRKSGLPLGMKVRFGYEPHKGDIMKVSTILASPKPFIPRAVVTPDGEWHEKGAMGWWGISTNDKPQTSWQDEVLALYAKYRTHMAVLCDLHI